MTTTTKLKLMIMSFIGHVRLAGFIHAVRFFLRKHILKNDELKLKVKGEAFPIYLRNRSSDLRVFGQIMINEEYRSGIRSLAPKVIMDCGANIGLASLYFAHRFPHASIYAFEPEKSNYKMLQRNVAGYPNIHTFQKAVWSKSTKLLLNTNNDHDSYSVGNATSRIDQPIVEGVSIPEIMIENHLIKIDLLKVDIEGAELELLTKNIDWIEQTQVIIVEIHDRINPGSSSTINNLMAKYFEVSHSGEYTVYSKIKACSVL